VDQAHSFLVTEAGFPNLVSFYRSKEYCITLERLKVSCAGDRRNSLDEAQPNLCSTIDQVCPRKSNIQYPNGL